MAISRNPREFLERVGLIRAHVPPRPRLNVSTLLVNQIPLEAPLPTQGNLEDYEGSPPPDRGSVKPWPNQ